VTPPPFFLFFLSFFLSFFSMLHTSITFGVKIPTLHARNTNMYDMVWSLLNFLYRDCVGGKAEIKMIWSFKCFCMHMWYKISGVTITDSCDQNSVSYISHLNHFAHEKTIINIFPICLLWM
jgi:hypothetical protein